MDNQIMWIGTAAIVLGAVVRFLKSDSPLPEWLHVPKGWRPVLALALGQVSAILETVVMGTPWKEAMAGGLVSALVAMGGHEGIVERLRGGKEPAVPFARDTGRGTGKNEAA